MHCRLLIVHRNLSSAAGKPGTPRTCEPLDGRKEKTGFDGSRGTPGGVHSTPARLRMSPPTIFDARACSAQIRSGSLPQEAHVLYPEAAPTPAEHAAESCWTSLCMSVT